MTAAAERRGGGNLPVRVVDVCSGAGGPVRHVRAQMLDAGVSVPFVLTDLYPNLPAWQSLSREDGN